MPGIHEFFSKIGLPEILLILFVSSIIIGVRESSSLGIFKRRSRNDKSSKETKDE